MTRRAWLTGAGVLTTLTFQPKLLAAIADPLQAILTRDFPGADIQPGRVHIDLPALAENGNSVRIKVNVDSPMTASDYVRFIQIIAQANPLPDVARFELFPATGLAEVETRIRVSAEQDIVVIAGLSDGSLVSGSAHIVVTVAACLDALY
ncbi:MAG: thiosulfate oxidation carrier protein SoxY [bacterium]